MEECSDVRLTLTVKDRLWTSSIVGAGGKARVVTSSTVAKDDTNTPLLTVTPSVCVVFGLRSVKLLAFMV